MKKLAKIFKRKTGLGNGSKGVGFSGIKLII